MRRAKNKCVSTWEAKIYCGLRERYTDAYHDLVFVQKVIEEYVNTVQWCVSLTSVRYIYLDGWEPGIVIGILKYPRFPLPIKELKKRTRELATILLKSLNQNRVCVVFPDKTEMLSALDADL